MTVTLSYDAANARVVIDADGLAAADVATIERSTDQLRWSFVRGATELAVTAGEIPTHYDYEFRPGAANFYRVRGIETGAITYVGVGAGQSGDNTSLTPALPASIVVGDLLVILAAIRNSGTGTVNTPSGWTVIRNMTANPASVVNAVVLGRRYQSGDSAPLVTFANGTAGATTLAQMAAIRRAELQPATSVSSTLNSSAQNIAHPALSIPDDDLFLLLAGWKQDDWTNADMPVGWTEISEVSSTSGSDAAIAWGYQAQTTATDIAAGSITITGGGSASSRGTIVALRHADYLNEQVEDVTPTLTVVRLNSPIRPFLNMTISLGGRDFDVEQAGRGTAHVVQDRSLPIGQSQMPGSQRYPLLVRTETEEALQQLRYLVESGDVLHLLAPAGKTVPAGGVYLLVDNRNTKTLRVGGERHHTVLQVQEVTAPGPDVCYALSTWATVLAAYGGSMPALLADNATIADLLLLIGDPSEVVVD